LGLKKDHRITLSDIARESGVSRQVVSAVLNPEKNSNIRYSRETHRRVMDVVKKWGYRPNRTAANLVSNRHGTIGLIVKNTGNIPSHCIQYMLDTAGKYNQILSMESLNSRAGTLPLFLREDCVDGLIIFEDLEENLLKEIERLKIPCLYVNNNMVHSSDSITFNEEGAMEQAVSLLHSKGKKHFAMFLPQSSHYSVQARQEGLKKAIKKRNLAAPCFYTMSNVFYHGEMPSETREIELQALTGFLETHKDIDAIILYSERMVSLCYQALRRTGKQIPRDTAVLGIHFTGSGLGAAPPLSVLRINPRELGEKLIEVINRKIEGEKEEDSPMVLDYELLEKESS